MWRRWRWQYVVLSDRDESVTDETAEGKKAKEEAPANKIVNTR